MQTIIVNGKVWCGKDHFVSAIGVNDGKIAFLGNDEDAKNLITNQTKVIDANNQLVIPGFNDSHQHLYSLGVFRSGVSLYGVDSIAKIIELGRKYIQENKLEKNTLILGRGWNQDYFTDEKRLLTRQDLDAISTEFPIVFKRACGHLLTCNSKALELANINKDTKQIDGGYFEYDENGELNGVFNENAQVLLRCLEKEVSIETIKEKIIEAANYAVSNGLTSIHSNDINATHVEFAYMLDAYNQLAKENKLPVRIYLQCCFIEPESFSKFINDGHYTNKGNDFVKIGPLKLFVDGSLGARTALLRTPYADDPTNLGVACLSQEQIDKMVELASNNKFQVAVHAIGDEAINRVLTSYEKYTVNNNELRHGIIHCQITDHSLLKRFAQSNILAYLQPIFLHYDLHIVESRVGKKLASTSYAFGTMEKLKIKTSYGTDAPVEDLNPFNNLHCAVNRQDLTNYPEKGFYLETEKVDITTALERYTMGSAYASFEENTKGSLEIGKYADLIILDQDLFTINSKQIKDTKVVLTMTNGKIVYQK